MAEASRAGARVRGGSGAEVGASGKVEPPLAGAAAGIRASET